MKIGEFLESKMNGMSQAELSRRSGVPASTISSIINRNNERVAIETLLKICEVIGCDINEYIDTLRTVVPEEMRPYKMPKAKQKSPPEFDTRRDLAKKISVLSEKELDELDLFLDFLIYHRGL